MLFPHSRCGVIAQWSCSQFSPLLPGTIVTKTTGPKPTCVFARGSAGQYKLRVTEWASTELSSFLSQPLSNFNKLKTTEKTGKGSVAKPPSSQNLGSQEHMWLQQMCFISNNLEETQ